MLASVFECTSVVPEYVQHVPEVECGAPLLTVTYAAPAPVVKHVACAVTCTAPAPVVEYAAHAVTYAAPAPEVVYVTQVIYDVRGTSFF